MAPMAMENGTDTITRPVICIGGWMNIPKWTSSGFIPWPSVGANGSLSSGLANPRIIARKKVRVNIRRPEA